MAWGEVDRIIDKVTWRDRHFAVINTQPAFSRARQIVVVGDLWLSNRTALLEQLGSEKTAPQTDIEIVAQLWERLGIESSGLARRDVNAGCLG